MRFPWPGLGIAGALAAAAIAERTLVRHAPPRLTVDFAQPIAVATNWGPYGAAALAIALAALAAAGVAYAAVALGRRPPALPALLAVVATALLAAWWMPVLFSSDAYAYAAYGELARFGASAYARAPIGASDPLLAAAAWQWGGTIPVCVYGPAFVGLARAVVTALASLGTTAQIDGMRALASGALLLCVPLAAAAYPGERTARLRAAATIALNPVAIWCAAEGHNDAIALGVALAGFAVARRGFWGIGAAIVAFSALVKSPGAIAAIALAGAERRARLGAAIGLALVAAVSLPLVFGVAAHLAPHARYTASASLQALLSPLGEPAAVAAAAAVALVLAAKAALRLRSGRADGWTLLGIAGWTLVPNPYPWYGIWLVALAALAPRTRAATVALLLSFTALLRYVPDAVGAPTTPDTVALAAAATLPLLALFAPSNDDRTR